MADSSRIDDLRRRVQKDPASIAFAQLAEELRRAGSFEESIEACHAGLAIHPGYLSARVTLGRALIETGALDEARSELELVLKSAPENLAAIRGLAEIFHRQGQLPEALAQYRAALALAKNDPDLQQTVEELAKVVDPPKPAHGSDGLSFDQIKNELFAAAPPQPVASAPSTSQIPPSTLESAPSTLESAPSTTPVQSSAQAEHERAQRTVGALEQMLDAIHVARTQPRA
jgi:tetratricopeptide (TPR) repeat protein